MQGASGGRPSTTLPHKASPVQPTTDPQAQTAAAVSIGRVLDSGLGGMSTSVSSVLLDMRGPSLYEEVPKQPVFADLGGGGGAGDDGWGGDGDDHMIGSPFGTSGMGRAGVGAGVGATYPQPG